MSKTTPKEVDLSIPSMKIKPISIEIRSLSPLIFHKWSEKAKKQIRDKQQKKAGSGSRPIRNPQKEYEDSFYYNNSGEISFPALCIKNSMVNATRFIDSTPMTFIRGAVFVEGDEDGLIKVSYKEKDKRMREDMVRVMRGGADLRYRGELNRWSMRLSVVFNESVISVEQVANLLNIAGFSIGIGEWRPEKNGDYGRFTVSS